MTPFLGQIQSFAFGIVPKGWATCAGQVLPISQNQALFAVIGTTFGGNGTTTFALPDLRSRTPIASGRSYDGQTYNLGQVGGEEQHTLQILEVPTHNHAIMGSGNNSGLVGVPLNNLPAKPAVAIYAKNTASDGPLSNAAIAKAGGSLPHENRQPYLVINWCIALQGIFPSRS